MDNHNKKCPTCKQNVTEEHKNLIEKFSTKKYLDKVKEKLGQKEEEDKKTSKNIVKDVLVLLSGFFIGKYFTGLSLSQFIILLLFVAVIAYIILGEILGVPALKWHVVRIKFKDKKEAKDKWETIHYRFFHELNVKAVDLKKGRYRVFIGILEETSEILFASRYKKGIDFLVFEIFSGEEGVTISEEIYSHIQSLINFKFLPNRGWFPKITSGFTEDWELTRFNISLMAAKKNIIETYEILCNQVDSLKKFEKTGEGGYDEAVNYLSSDYIYKEGLFEAKLFIYTLGSEITVQVYYHEKGGIEYDRYGEYAQAHLDLLKEVFDKVNDVLKDLNSKKINYKTQRKEISMFKGKYRQREVTTIKKHRDRKF